MGKDYHDKPKNIRKDGTISAGKGKERPHHREIRRRALKSMKGRDGVVGGVQGPGVGGNDTLKNRLKIEKNNYVPHTPNKYQSNIKKLDETSHCATYEWYEDNGHKDHLQLRRATVPKEDERCPTTVTTITTEQYQNNYKEIFGNRKRGVNVKGGYKKFKKTY